MFGSPNKYFTANSLGVPLNNATEADYDGPETILGWLFPFVVQTLF